tara:strand:- start:104 stop:214 length:111 start_codon:yes stop_codon:yes gene_type:complete
VFAPNTYFGKSERMIVFIHGQSDGAWGAAIKLSLKI